MHVVLKTQDGPTEVSLQTRLGAKVLVVDDEAAVRRAIHGTLYGLGFDIGEAATGEEAIALCRIVHYDAVLLDIQMPGKGGIETCRELRQLVPRVAILILSVHGEQERKIEALEAGADDYVTKPFHIRELVARIYAALRRSNASVTSPEATIAIGGIELNVARRLVKKNNYIVHLTPKEFDVLHILMTHAGHPMTHSKLLHAVWGEEYASQVEYLRTFVRQLRKKLENDSGKPEYLLTDNHVGYRFVDPADAPGRDDSQE